MKKLINKIMGKLGYIPKEITNKVSPLHWQQRGGKNYQVGFLHDKQKYYFICDNNKKIIKKKYFKTKEQAMAYAIRKMQDV